MTAIECKEAIGVAIAIFQLCLNSVILLSNGVHKG